MAYEILAIIVLILITSIVVFSSYATFKAPRRLVIQTVKRCIEHPEAVIDVAFEKIGGWLYLWLGTVIFLSWKIIVGLIAILPPFSGDIWAMANDRMSYGYHPLMRFYLLFDLICRTGLLYAGTVIGIDFVRRRHYVPKLIVGFLLIYLVILVTEQLLMKQIMVRLQEFLYKPPQFWTPELVIATFACLIWVPYFLFSKRVKTMFKIANSA